MVLFTISSNWFRASPHTRRQFLDRLLLQANPNTFEARELSKILNHRCAFKTHSGRQRQWEAGHLGCTPLYGGPETLARSSHLCRFLRGSNDKDYQSISGSEETLSVSYHSHEDRYEEAIAHRNSDIQSGSTSVGPHRDDFIAFLDHSTGRAVKELPNRVHRGKNAAPF